MRAISTRVKPRGGALARGGSSWITCPMGALRSRKAPGPSSPCLVSRPPLSVFSRDGGFRFAEGKHARPKSRERAPEGARSREPKSPPMTDIFDEVDDDLRRDRMAAFWKRWGGLV